MKHCFKFNTKIMIKCLKKSGIDQKRAIISTMHQQVETAQSYPDVWSYEDHISGRQPNLDDGVCNSTLNAAIRSASNGISGSDFDDYDLQWLI
jgi:hypothetical protein